MSATASLPPVLTVAEVMTRYGMKDRRAARRVMDEAGAFMAAGRLLVRVDDLDEWEAAGKRARKPQEAPPPVAGVRARRSRRTPRSVPLGRDWWMEAAPQM